MVPRDGSHDRITKVSVGGSDAWYMIGHAYFDREFSARFRQILEDEYDLPQTQDKLWEDLYAEHINELDMRIRKYDPPIIHEFDSLDELRDFDPLFLENLDSEIFDNIVAVLGCDKSEIRNVYPLKQGLTNLSCHDTTDDGESVYRHPGVGTEPSWTARQRKLRCRRREISASTPPSCSRTPVAAGKSPVS
ncbi:MAG: hypothetical protein ACLTXI_01840 [Collinsella sp.]